MSDWKQQAVELAKSGLSWRKIANQLGKSKSTVSDWLRAYFKQGNTVSDTQVSATPLKAPVGAPRVLIFDIETSPIIGAVWGLWQQNLSLDMIESEWFILSFAAKWLGDSEDKVMYDDMRGMVNTEDDRHLLDQLWKLLDEADIVITQNGKKFDVKKVNARFVMNGYKPPKPYKHIDTLQIAKSQFGFTSNKLAWMTDKLCTKHKKLSHAKFSGFLLWKEMLADNTEAWEECRDYNTMDVLSLEELYLKLAAWDNRHPNFNLYSDEPEHTCRCGSHKVVKDGFAYTGKSKFQQYRCLDCGAVTRDSINQFSKEKRVSLQLNIIN